MNLPLPGPPDDLPAGGRVGAWLSERVDAVARIARHPLFWVGVRELAGLSIGFAAWAFMTGVAMAKSGLSPLESVLMSLRRLTPSASLQCGMILRLQRACQSQ